MIRFGLGNAIFPISFGKAKRIMGLFEAAARETFGDGQVILRTYKNDFLEQAPHDTKHGAVRALDFFNAENELSVFESIYDFTANDWRAAKYVFMQVKSLSLANCFMNAHFKGVQPNMITFDVKGCGDHILHARMKGHFTVLSDENLRNTRRASLKGSVIHIQ